MRKLIALLLLLSLTGCKMRGLPNPNPQSKMNDLRGSMRGTKPQKVARADPDYVAPAPERNDPNDPPYLYPESQPYRGRQHMTQRPDTLTGIEAEMDHYSK